jgi:hypothetical protein
MPGGFEQVGALPLRDLLNRLDNGSYAGHQPGVPVALAAMAQYGETCLDIFRR